MISISKKWVLVTACLWLGACSSSNSVNDDNDDAVEEGETDDGETIVEASVTFFPADAATEVARDTEITATFSDTITEPSLWSDVFTLKKDNAGDSLCTAVTYEAVSRVATCEHAELDGGASYTLAITGITGVTDGEAAFQTEEGLVTLVSGIVDFFLDHGDHSFRCDADHCYFVDRTNGRICRVATSGGDVACPYEGLNGPDVLNLQGDTLCWSDRESSEEGAPGLISCGPKGGGDAVTSTLSVDDNTSNASQGFEISEDGNTFYFGNQNCLHTATRGMDGYTDLDCSFVDVYIAHLIESNIYFIPDFSDDDAVVPLGISKIPALGGGVTSLVDSVADSMALISEGLAFDETRFCFLTGTLAGSDGAAYCAPLSGAEDAVVVITDLLWPLNLQIDGDNLIIGEMGGVDLEAQSYAGTGRILSVPLAGGSPTALAENLVNFGGGLQMVGDYIYFTDLDPTDQTLSIRKVHK